MKSQKCECGKNATRDIVAEHSQGNIDGLMKENHRWSISMGCPINQLDYFRKKYPNSTYNDRGQLLIKNRVHKLKEAKLRGMQELDKEFRPPSD